MWALRRFVSDNQAALGGGMSTGTVCFTLVKPATRAGKCAYVELLRGSLSDQGCQAVGKANVFLSHAWNNSFEDLVDAAEVALLDEPNAFVWRVAPPLHVASPSIPLSAAARLVGCMCSEQQGLPRFPITYRWPCHYPKRERAAFQLGHGRICQSSKAERDLSAERDLEDRVGSLAGWRLRLRMKRVAPLR